MQRCGVQSPLEAASLAKVIAESPGLHFGGLMTYPSSERANLFFQETKKLLEADGISVERTSGGSTNTIQLAPTFDEITEHRAGEYIYGDRYQIDCDAMKVEDCSLKVIVTVVSRPTENRGIIDGGSKTLSSDVFKTPGHGLILEYPEAVIYSQSEEHGHVDFSACEHKPEIGERLSIIPNHCCPVTNLFDQVVGIRKGEVEIVWQVACRGLVQ
jgi:D-serine deaminase-like pyridoxal phosphate-dependent protein